MGTGRSNLLVQQIGEHRVTAELARNGFIAVTLSGNVPDFDVLAVDDKFNAIPIQVKTIKGKGEPGWQFDAKRFLQIEVRGGKQRVIGKVKLRAPNLPTIFVRLQEKDDEFYIFRLGQLQSLIRRRYIGYLKKHGGRRPKKPNSTHTTLTPRHLRRFRDKWEDIRKWGKAKRSYRSL
jgi:hypothetical protein